MPSEARIMPSTTTGRGPVRGITRVWAITAANESAKVIGRKARPVSTGEKPSVCCR
jgi:hypothetical protein